MATTTARTTTGWEPDTDDRIRRIHADGNDHREIAVRLGLKPEAVRGRLMALGLGEPSGGGEAGSR